MGLGHLHIPSWGAGGPNSPNLLELKLDTGDPLVPKNNLGKHLIVQAMRPLEDMQIFEKSN